VPLTCSTLEIITNSRIFSTEVAEEFTPRPCEDILLYRNQGETESSQSRQQAQNFLPDINPKSTVIVTIGDDLG
jgi:hypothetical protein